MIVVSMMITHGWKEDVLPNLVDLNIFPVITFFSPQKTLIGAMMENFLPDNPKTILGSTYATKMGKVGQAKNPFPPLPILSNTFVNKIGPCNINWAMLIQQAHNVSNAVAQGYHLCM